MFESIFIEDTGVSLTLESGIIAIIAAVAMGTVLSIAHIHLNKERAVARTFAITLVVLPAIIAIIVALVGNNVARAFSIAGIFSIVRFRSMQQDTKELAFVLLSMAIGLGCGMGYVGYAVAFGLILGAVSVVAQLAFRDRHEYKTLKVFMPENLDYGETLNNVLAKYAKTSQLIQVKTADLGSLYKLTYKIALLPETNEKQLIDDLRTKNGNLTISLTNAYELEER